MICVNCGKEVRDGAKFCTFCGTPMAAPAPAAEPAPAPTPVTEPTPASAPITESAPESAPVTEPTPASAPIAESVPEPTPVTEPTSVPAPVQSAPAPTPAPMPTPVQPMPMPAQPAGMVPPAAGGQKKKSHVGLIVLIIVIALLVLLLAGGGLLAFLFLNRPINKINKAMEAGDMVRVVELYGNLSSGKDKESVSEELLAYAKEVRDDYLKEKNGMDYAKAIEILNMLADASLETDDEIEDIRAFVNNVNESRAAYAAAEAYLADGEYELALEEYAKVTADDLRLYDKAQDGIEAAVQAKREAEEAIRQAQREAEEAARQAQREAEEAARQAALAEGKALVGTWEMKCDVADLVRDEMGSEFENFESSFEVTLLIDFNEDGTFKLYVDENAFLASFDSWLDDLIAYGIDMMYAELEKENNMSRAEIDKFIKGTFGKSIEDLMREMIAEELDVDLMVSELQTAGTYETRDDRLYLVENGDTLDEDEYNTFLISGDTLTLGLPDGAYQDYYEILPELSYPLTFRRR